MCSEPGAAWRTTRPDRDAPLAVIGRLPADLHLDDDPAIIALNKMLHQIADVKEKHRRPALRPRARNA